MRAELGVDAGDEVDVTIALDEAPREVVVPDDLAEALTTEPGLRERFDALAFTHRKEFAQWLTQAKRAETRERRLAQAVEMIRAGRTRS